MPTELIQTTGESINASPESFVPKHKYQRPNKSEYENLVREERKLTRMLESVKDRINAKRELIAKGYRLVDTDEKTKKRQVVKREREHLRTAQVENLRVELYRLEEDKVRTQFQLKEVRNKLRTMTRAMKYFARLDKKVAAESFRADQNEAAFIANTVKKIRVKQPQTFTLTASDLADESEEATTPLLAELFRKAPAVYEVVTRRATLKMALFNAIIAESTTQTRQVK